MHLYLTIPTYPLIVDYERSVEDGVRAGGYDSSDPNVISRNFPTRRSGRAEIVVELIRVVRHVGFSTEYALQELDRRGYRPAESHELLTLGERHPDVQRLLSIVALGSVWLARPGYRYVLSLDGHGSWRSLSLRLIWGDWSSNFWFAAVRK